MFCLDFSRKSSKMSTTTTKSTKFSNADVKNLVAQVSLEDRYAEFELFIYDKEKNVLTEVPHPTFEFVGDVNGPIMPHMSMNKGFDVGPRFPCVKFGLREADPMYDVIAWYNRAIHVGYYAAILEKWMGLSDFNWVPGFEFHGFFIDSFDDDCINVRAISNQGLVDNLFEKVRYSSSDKKRTEEAFRSAFKKGFQCDVKISNDITIPTERPIFYESKKGKASGSKTIYIETKLLHKTFPGGKNKYRAVNEKESEEMLKAKNWGIMIPMLTSATVGGEKRYFQPGQTMNWVDYPASGFKEVSSATDSNYFVGKVLYTGKKTTHFAVDATMTNPITLKYNIGWVCNVFKLPEVSSFNRNAVVSSGFDSMDIDEDKILAMHSGGVQAPMKEVNADSNAVVDDSAAPSPKGSKAKMLGLKKKRDSDGAPAADNGKMSDDE